MRWYPFLPFFKYILEVVFCEGVKHRLRFCPDYLNCGSLSALSSIRGAKILQGPKSGE
jgi:hypothetical protein